MTKVKRRRARKSKRKMTIHKYRYYESKRFFEPNFFIELSLHVFNRNHTKLHIEVTKRHYKENRDERVHYRCYTDSHIANSRRFLRLVEEIDKFKEFGQLCDFLGITD